MAAPIGNVGNLVNAIRTQLTRTSDSPASQRAPGRRTGAAGRAYAPDQLEALIELRISKLARDDPRRGQKAFRVFLEAVLLSHFGDGMVNDPAFSQLVDDVQSAMESDSQCQMMVDSAVAHLLSRDR